jgi:hypothetical protein
VFHCFLYIHTHISSKYHQLFNQIKTFFFEVTNKDKIKRVTIMIAISHSCN